MKKLQKNLMLVAAAATALSSGAEATWEPNINSKDFRVGIGQGRGIMADFNGDGRLDIYYSGSAFTSEYEHKGTFSWQTSSNMLYNNGDGTFEHDIFTSVPTGEFDENDKDDDGNPREWYKWQDPIHGIMPASNGHYATIDYNNDGCLDLIVAGMRRGNDWDGLFVRVPERMRTSVSYDDGKRNEEYCMVLYKNLGNGHFEIEPNFNIPIVIPDRDSGYSMFFNTIAWGDYDHDGYADLALSGIAANPEPGEPERIAQLWRNINGTGSFEQMNIAETWGGAWTNDVTVGEGDDKIVAIPSHELENWFLLLSGNVVMADVNNDGWLDLVFDGWADKMNDGVYEGGSNGRVYLNQPDGNGGRKFVDITDRSGNFYLTRAGNTQLVDLNGDGYFDLLNSGYGDHNIGYKTMLFYNNLGDDPEADPTTIFNSWVSMDQYGLPNEECAALVVRDFDGDDVLDMIYVGKQNNATYYGNAGGTYSRSADFPVRNNDNNDGYECFGDLTGNGLCDRFLTGWKDVQSDADMDGKNYHEIFGVNGWTWAKYIFNNTTDVEIEAPEAPSDIKTSIDEDAKTLTIEWTDVETPNCAYNVVIVTPSGKVIANIPVNPETGALKVAENKNIAIRPFVQKYTLPYNEVGEYNIGVQALSLNNEKASPIAWGDKLTAGVGNIEADLADTNVKVTVNGNTIVANAIGNADVKVIDMMGRTIATGVTNAPITVEAKGVLIVNAAGRSVKIVK